MQKKLLFLILTMTLLLGAVPAYGAAETVVLYPNNTAATVNGTPVTIEAVPYVEAGTTMVPLRFLCEKILHAQINWDNTTKTVEILNDTLLVELNIASGGITANGKAYKSNPAPTLKNGYTFVPLRLLSELFGCKVKYTAPPATITITLAGQPKPEPPVTILAPVALVQLPESYTKGGALEIIDGSYDLANRPITAKRWQVGGMVVPDLKAALNKQSAGLVELSYQVQNDGGVWSTPWEGSLLVIDNQSPQIVGFTAASNQVNIGDTLIFDYKVENESWEAMAGYNWRWIYQNEIFAGQPRAFFAPGEYTVQLSGTDAYGNQGPTASYQIQVSARVDKTEERYKFSSLIPGELFINAGNVNHNELPNAKYHCRTIGSTTLIASNNPETVTQYGILYRGHAPGGNVRLRYHHVNGTNAPLYLKALVHNPGSQEITITLHKRALAGPNNSAIFTGMKVVEKFLTNDVILEYLTVPAGGTITLNPQLSTLAPQDVAAALLEMDTSGPLDFYVTAGASAAQATNWQTLPDAALVKTHVRGTFYPVDTAIEVEASGQSEKIVLGREDTPGGFAHGRDEVRGVDAINYGNRGVLVTLKITAAERTGIWFNPRGTGYFGVILWNGTPVTLSNAGMFRGSTHGAVLGTLQPGETVNLTYLTPSGTDSDALILLIPESEWDSADKS